MRSSVVLCLLLLNCAVQSHEQTPTYPTWKPSGIDGIKKTNIRVWNKRPDIEYYEIGVFEEDLKTPIPFVTAYKVIPLKYLKEVKFDIYIRESNLAGDELNGIRPVRPQTAFVFGTNADSVNATWAHDLGWDGDVRVELCEDVTFPNGIDFIPVGWRGGEAFGVHIGDFCEAPFHGGKGLRREDRPAGKLGRLETQAIYRKLGVSDVGDGGGFGSNSLCAVEDAVFHPF